MLVHTSIGGNKTDPYMERIIEHQTYIERDGLVFNQVKLTQKHTWGEEEEHRITELLNSFGFNEIEGWVMNILGADVNTSGMRFYVPHGTRLVSTKGIDANEISLEYDEDLELDYFYFTTTIYPGTEETLTLTYEIPFTLDFEPLDEYRLNVFKQPGDKNTIFKKIISADSYLVHYRSFPETITEDPDQYNLFSYESELTQDLHLAQLWGE